MKPETIKKSQHHQVEYKNKGTTHYFNVKSGLSGNDYEVIVKLNCECRFQSIQGVPNKKICSHIYAVLRKIVEENGEIQ